MASTAARLITQGNGRYRRWRPARVPRGLITPRPAGVSLARRGVAVCCRASRRDPQAATRPSTVGPGGGCISTPRPATPAVALTRMACARARHWRRPTRQPRPHSGAACPHTMHHPGPPWPACAAVAAAAGRVSAAQPRVMGRGEPGGES